MVIYEFLYSSYDSGYITISLHKTKIGAYKAMKKHKLESFYEWYNDRIIYGKNSRFPYDFGKEWDIGEQELLD